MLLWNRRYHGKHAGERGAVDRRIRYTPPQACGLLNGTFRAELLERGTIQERVVLWVELRSINGLAGQQPSRMDSLVVP